MSATYTVEVSGSSDLVVEDARVEVRTLEIGHRNNEDPPSLARIMYEYSISGVVSEDTPSQVVAGLGDLLQDYVHKTSQPEYVRVKDSGGAVLPQWGDVDPVGSPGLWENLRLSSVSIGDPEDPASMRAWAPYQLIYTVERVFPDANGLLDFEQQFDEQGGDGGLKTRTLSSTLRLAQDSPNSVTTPAILSLVRLAVPAGWVRGGPTNASNGVQVTWLDEPRRRSARVVSIVKQQGASGSVTDPGENGAELTTELVEDPVRGVIREVTRVRAATLDGVESSRPDNARGQTAEDVVNNSASATFERFLQLGSPASGAVTRTRWQIALSQGGQSKPVTIFTGNVRPSVGLGPYRPYLLTGTVDISALGAVSLQDVPIPPGPPGAWVELTDRATDTMPEIEEFGRDPSQHLSLRRVTREWLWGGPGDPRSDSAFRDWVMRQHQPSETP